MFAYCINNPVIMIDITGQYCVAIMDDDGNLLNDWLIEGASSGGYSATGNYIGPGSAYYNYSVRSLTAAYDARLGSYYSSPVSAGISHTSSYCVAGAVQVVDSMARNNSYSPKTTNSKVFAEDKKNTPDQDAVLQLAKEYKKTGMSLSEANTMWEWAQEYGLTGKRYHGPQTDSYLDGKQPHIKINGKHINIYD